MGRGGERAKAGVSNERFSLRLQALMQTSHPHLAFVVGEKDYSVSRGNIKISNVLKIAPRLRAVSLGLSYQGIGSSINFSFFFINGRAGQ